MRALLSDLTHTELISKHMVEKTGAVMGNLSIQCPHDLYKLFQCGLVAAQLCVLNQLFQIFALKTLVQEVLELLHGTHHRLLVGVVHVIDSLSC